MDKNDVRATRLEPQTLAFLHAMEAQGEPPIHTVIHTLTPVNARTMLFNTQVRGQVAKQPAIVQERSVQAGPTGTIALRIVRPQGNTSPLPAILYLHGGGWVMGDGETHDRLVRELVNGAQCAAIFVEYARAPEAKYPIAIEQAYGALEWVAKHGATIGVDASRLAVVGDSVGGNMAAVLTLLSKHRQGPKISFQLLFYPVTDSALDTDSYRHFGDGDYWLSTATMRWFWDGYVAAEQRHLPTVAPLRASLEQLRGLPPALIITGENDVLRDEGEAYVHKLIEAGVTVTATRYLGTIHDFVLLDAIHDAPAARAAIAQATAALRHAFAR